MDMDGVLILGHRALPGAQALLEFLRAEALPFMLLTNDGSRSHEERRQKLARGGLEVTVEDIVCSTDGIYELLESRPAYRELRYFVLGYLGDPHYADLAGLTHTSDLAELAQCDGVIMGEGEEHYDWERSFTAIINFLVAHPGAPLIVPNPDEYYPKDGGELRVGAGGQARFIQQVVSAHGEPASMHYLGKPYGPIYAHTHHALEAKAGQSLARDKILMMGDSLHSDMRGGLDFGYRTALLLTGITRPDKLAAQQEIRPELVFERL